MAIKAEQTAATQEELLQRLSEIEPFVGNTPLYPIKRISPNPNVKISAKLEWQQLGNSVKARAAFNIINQGIKSKELTPDKQLLDATSGNTGIAYAAIGASLGIPVTLCIPENATKERLSLLRALNAELIYTSKFEATDGSQEKAKALKEAHPDKYFYADQYSNENNWKAHYHTTGPEIYTQTDGELTHFISGLGTTGTFTGTTRKLKALKPSIKAVSLQPDMPLHGLEGWKHLSTTKIPAFYDETMADQNITVDTDVVYQMLKEVAQKEGFVLSPSAAANLLGAVKLAKNIDEGHIVTVFPDNATNYQDLIQEIFI